MDEFNMDLAFLKKRQTDDIVENVMDEKNIFNIYCHGRRLGPS